jgi:hypothetical protein
MTIDHTGHAASGCPQFDVTNLKLTTRLTADEHNANELMGKYLHCRDCGQRWGAMVGGWRITPNGVFCDRCAEASD